MDVRFPPLQKRPLSTHCGHSTFGCVRGRVLTMRIVNVLLIALLIAAFWSASASVKAQTTRSGSELLAKSERSFSAIPFGASEPTPGLTLIDRDNCKVWGQCSYHDAQGVEHYFWEGELVVKSVHVAEVGDLHIDALGIGTARSLDEVIERVTVFLLGADVDCEDFADGTATCGAKLGEGWIKIIFDSSRRLTEVRIDAYHFT